MTAGGEPLADDREDPRLHAGEGRGQLDDVRHLAEQTAALLGLVLPCDTEQVDGVNVPQSRVAELLFDFLGDQLGVLHLFDGRDDDAVLSRLLNIVL